MNKSLQSLSVAAGLLAAALITTPAWSADAAASATAQNSSSGTAAATLTDGEVKKVDKENQKVTLKHGEIKNLGMPGMTMVFKVKDAAALDKLQVGDKVRFAAEKAEGAIVITQIESAK